ncbi:MAG: monovalent cation:proton antiporter-2 (CPA2) family protein [Gammaproteobacteria bacterium]|jgi:monovalent cation:proton antiporter-2 (CPA2) family protein
MLADVLILLIAAVLVVPIFQRLGLGSVLGYLAAGLIVGPAMLGLIEFVEQIRDIAELGVVFLLFVIGLELKPERLWTMRKLVFGLGTVQVAIVGWSISGIAYLSGFNPRPSIVIGFGLALSSTAFVLQLCAEQHILPKKEGRATLGVLLLQDLAVVPLLAMLQLFAPRSGRVGPEIGLGFLEGMGALILVIFVGRYAIRPLFKHIAASDNQEIFTATAVLLVLGTGWLMEHTGLSMALGAFLAGILLSDSEFRHQITADLERFRGLLLGLFFMAVGMLIDLKLLVSEPWLIIGMVAALLSIKIIIFYPVARLFSLTHGQALRAAFYLSQAGEFAFVLFGAAAVFGLFSDAEFKMLALVVAASMLTTPLMFRLAHRLMPHDGSTDVPGDALVGHAKPTENAVLVLGYGRFGEQISRVLHERGVPYLAIDNDALTVIRAHENHLPVYYGDATRPDVLHHLGCHKARLAIIAMDQKQAVEKTVRAIRQNAPDVAVFVRAHDEEDSRLFNELGVQVIVPEALEASLQLSAEVLNYLGASEEEVARVIKQLRDKNYDRLHGASTMASGGE